MVAQSSQAGDGTAATMSAAMSGSGGSSSAPAPPDDGINSSARANSRGALRRGSASSQESGCSFVQNDQQDRTDSQDRSNGPRVGRTSFDPATRYHPQAETRQRRRPERRRSSEGCVVSTADDSGGSSGKKQRRRSSFLSFGDRTGGSTDDLHGNGQSSSSKILDDKKTRAVFCLRVITILTLVVAAVVCATLTYIYVSRDEYEDFTTQYQDSVVKVAEAFQHGLDVKTSTSSTFSAMYTSRYGPQNSWPNVTMPNFIEQAAGQLRLSEGRALSFNPIITDETKAGWEAFAAASKDILEADPEKIQHVDNGIFGKTPPANGSRFPEVYVPVWQIAPIETNERAIMFNLHSERDRMRALDDVLQYKVPALTAILQLVQDGEDIRPSSILFYPVFDAFANATEAHSHSVVGTISIVFSWDVVLASILPAYIKGIVCVLESSVGEVFTYSITGETVTLLGEGDLHDASFDDQRYTVEADLEGTQTRLGEVDFLITYKLSMYPSEEMRNQYVTNRPVIYTTGVVLIFVLTSAIFLLYDYLVEHRQNKVMRAAIQTSKIVDTMFPAVVRDRLFASSQNDKAGGAGPDSDAGIKKSGVRRLSQMVTDPKGRMKQFLAPNVKAKQNKPDFNVPVAIKAGGSAAAPIADLFPNTSIMFCDIVGFTAWSSKHEPNDVFTLLETLFWEFDELANLYDVFKLGTIGDCYIAVTGLPDPQADHASLLAEFAEECRRKMNEVNASLEDSLGIGSSSLSMRFGIHSGPVTAGVLRGQKSRFELFGDTINTASRMESTGVANRIQVSEETAELLREDGRGDWLVPREGLVRAKGKGDLNTYWLNVVLPGDADYAELGDYMSQSAATASVANETETRTDARERYYRGASDMSSNYAEDSTAAATRGGGGVDVAPAADDLEAGNAADDEEVGNASVSTGGWEDEDVTQACTEDAMTLATTVNNGGNNYVR